MLQASEICLEQRLQQLVYDSQQLLDRPGRSGL